MSVLVVGISDQKIALPPDTLITYALGSCVGICLYDPVTRIGGLSHIMLPTGVAASPPLNQNIYKYADTAIPELVRQMELRGAIRSRLKAKIAGGAQMFVVQGSSKSGTWQIGQRNAAAVTSILQSMHIPIVAQDLLKNYGRTQSFDPATGVMTIKAMNYGAKEY